MARNKNKTYKTLLSVLANGSTEQSRALLKKYSGEDAQNINDLEVKLARLYASSTSKKEIENEFAQIHPHKEFILKYVPAKVEIKATDIVEKPLETTVIKKTIDLDDNYIPADGDQPCPCAKCMAYSNAIGDQPQGSMRGNQNIMVLGIVSVVAILGMVLYINKNK